MRSNQRLTIAGMLWMVATVGVCFAALRSATAVWAGLMAVMILAALLSGAVAAVFSRGRERAFWLGFAAFGWAFLLAEAGLLGMDFKRALDAPLSPWADAFTPIAQNGITPLAQNGTVILAPGDPAAWPQKSFPQAAGIRARFVAISEMSMTLLFAMAGGLIGWSIAGYAGVPVREESPQ